MSSLRAKWWFTEFVWCCATVTLQVFGWLAAGVRAWDFAAVVVVLALGATLQGWFAD
jgi:hypothetical protein